MDTFIVDKQEEVVKQLNELFGDILNLDIIKSVANNCSYDINATSNQLIELTSGVKLENKVEKHGKCDPASSNFGKGTQKKPKKIIDLERTITSINSGYKVLVILRGLPGSGKSTLAKNILQETVGYSSDTAKLHILSADNYFVKNGVYCYDSSRIGEAHGWNHSCAFKAMSRGVSPIVIDNTNTQMWEMKPYAAMATDYGYIIEILEPNTHWCFNERVLTTRNSHGVPRGQIRNMLDRYEKNVTDLKLRTAYNLRYNLQKPPQLRSFPPPNNIPPKNCPSKNTIQFDTGPFTVSNQCEQNDNIKETETINLMDFNEGTTSETVEEIEKDTYAATRNVNIVDKILMHCEEACSSSDVLQPLPQNIGTIRQNTGNFLDLETAWGVNEKALQSWDIVTPLKQSPESPELPKLSGDNIEQNEKFDISVETDDNIFQIMRNLNSNVILNNNFQRSFKVIETHNRDINRYTPCKPFSVPKKLMLDKSCLTEDIYENCDVHIEQLESLFPDIPTAHVKYWYNKCKGDLVWTIELLLGQKDEILNEPIDDDSMKNETTVDKLGNSDSDNSNSSSHADVPKTNKCKRKSQISLSDELKELKKCIESKININEVHYSRHLLKIKQLKFGSTVSGENGDGYIGEINNFCQPGTSKAEVIETTSGDILMVDADIDFDDLDLENRFEKEGNRQEELETVELNLGENFVDQLEKKFGDPNLVYPQGFQPVVQVPITLAKQLYTFYIESVCQQMEAQKTVMETLIKEDEEFARKLQEKESSKLLKTLDETPKLQIIMDEQMQQSKWQKEVDKWKDLTPDTLAAKMTRDKLFSIFPTLSKDILLEMLVAHDNRYEETVEILLANTTPDNVNVNISDIKVPPLSESIINEMKEAAENSRSEKSEHPTEAKYYREEANKYLKKRTDLYQKAQQYQQRGMTEVAQFYSGLAAKQTSYYDHANNMAATAFLDEHSKRLQDFNTLDLHFLYVKEALPALDVFIDRNINLLRLSASKHSEYLQIITGRGKRSENGVSKIKPAVVARLKRRQISFIHLNPGLLKIKITKMSLVTSEI